MTNKEQICELQAFKDRMFENGIPVEEYSEFEESKHPRANDGKFTSGGESGGSSEDKPQPKDLFGDEGESIAQTNSPTPEPVESLSAGMAQVAEDAMHSFLEDDWLADNGAVLKTEWYNRSDVDDLGQGVEDGIKDYLNDAVEYSDPVVHKWALANIYDNDPMKLMQAVMESETDPEDIVEQFVEGQLESIHGPDVISDMFIDLDRQFGSYFDGIKGLGDEFIHESSEVDGDLAREFGEDIMRMIDTSHEDGPTTTTESGMFAVLDSMQADFQKWQDGEDVDLSKYRADSLEQLINQGTEPSDLSVWEVDEENGGLEASASVVNPKQALVVFGRMLADDPQMFAEMWEQGY